MTAPQAKLDKLDAVLAQTSTTIEDAALFAEMLSLPNDGRYPALELTPEQRRQRTLDALISQVQALARQSPLLMIFEDAHWTDPTSLEVLGRIVDRIRSLRVLLIVTFRPDFEPPWVGRPYVTFLAINRLGEREILAMIEGVIGNKLLPANIRQDIIERTDGIPLFVEEMTKAVLEAESQGAGEHLAATVPSSALAVPASLQASLMARLDRLGSAKEVAQIGAAIGREFSHSLLAAVARKPETAINSALDRLMAAGLLFRQGAPPHSSYLFKHALVQDAAYGTLLREPRRALHARIAETLEREFPEIAENQPELLARHCTEAGLTEQAASLWGKAGQRSLERSALVEAVAQLRRALDQFATLPPTRALRREEIRFQVALITPLIHIQGYAAPETKAAAERAHLLIERAEALGEPPEDPLLLFSALYGIWVVNLVAFNRDVCRGLAVQFLALAEKQGATVPLMMGHRLMGMALVHSGDIVEGRAHFDRAIELYDPASHRQLATHFGQDIRVAILSYRSWALWLLGFPDAALADVQHALEDAREIRHAASLMYALTNTSMTLSLHRSHTRATAQLDEVAAMAAEQGSVQWKVSGMGMRGSVLAQTGKAADAVQIITEAIGAWRRMGATIYLPWWTSHLAWAFAELGQLDDAWRCIGEAMATIETTKERWFEAEANRIAGEIALNVAPARRCESGRVFRAARSRLRVHSKQNHGNYAPQ